MTKLPTFKEEYLGEHLSYNILNKKLLIDKVEEYILYCPRCVALRMFNREPYYDPYTGEDRVILYRCSECKKVFGYDGAYVEDTKSLRKLIDYNAYMSKFHTDDIKIVSFDNHEL